ncbi:MAG: hypothetical protein A2Y33_08410 [Spirochaetes bacterium GWF1_51_8]|nr:MAG: hypothetical protein A2Y33_08410 [Spirochaetes bacterium GWF1_51_8]
MLKKSVFPIGLFLFLALSSAQPQTIEVFNAMSIVDIIQERIAKIETFTGTFAYVFDGKSFNGTIIYKAPDKFRMDFKGVMQRIMSDGKYLWLLFDSQDIAVKEILDKSKANPMMGWNLKRLIKDYAPMEPKEGFKVKYKDQIAYKIIFEPRNNTAGFRKIEMIASLEGYILKIKAVTSMGKNLEFELTYNMSSINQPVSDGSFVFVPDENTQMYENLLTQQ